MRKGVLEKQRAALEAYNLDALVAASPDNVTYSLGFSIPSQTLDVRNRIFLVVVGTGGLVKMIAASPEVTFIQGQEDAPETISYDEFSGYPMAELAAVVKQTGLSSRRVGLEVDFLPAVHFACLTELLPGVEFIPAAPIYDRLRMVKTAAEIESLRRANRAARYAWARGCEAARIGITERQLARLIIEALFDEGMDEVRLIQVGSGRRSSFANPFPTDRKIEKGDLVKVDIFAKVDGYYSDTGGAVVAGPPPAEYERIWAGMVGTQQAILAHMRPGVSTRTLWDVFEREFGRVGLKPVNRFIGHSLGLSLHEEPFIGREREVPLAEGMVMAVEPIFKIPGELGFHLEDVVAITASGYDALTDPQEYNELKVIR
jgi:Xaa-Pro aminopeptidase